MLQRPSIRLLVWACLAGVCFAQRAEHLLAQNPCSSKTTCSDCIRTPTCAWCFAPEYNAPRCFNPAMEGGTAGCNEAYLFNPDNQRSVDPKYNMELTRGNLVPTPTLYLLVGNCNNVDHRVITIYSTFMGTVICR